MPVLNIHQAKMQLSRLLERLAQGEEIIIAKAGRPVARLVPIAAADGRRPLGVWRGRVRLAADFDAPLLPDIAHAFGAEP